MHKRLRSLVLPCLGGCVATLALHRLPPREPPLRLAVEVDGQTLQVSAGKPFELTVNGKRKSIKVSVLPNRLFSAGGVSFEYPRAMEYTVDRDQEGVEIWTLDRNDSMLMIQRYAGQSAEAMLDAVVKSTIKEFDGAGKEAKEKVSYSLGGKTRQATRIDFELGGSKIVQDYVAFDGKDAAIILMIQDSSGSGRFAESTRRLVELLGETLKLER